MRCINFKMLHTYRNDVVDVILPEFGQYWNDKANITHDTQKRLQEPKQQTQKITRYLTDYANIWGFFLWCFQWYLFYYRYYQWHKLLFTRKLYRSNTSRRNYCIPKRFAILYELPFQESCDTAKWKYTSYKEEVGNGLLAVLLVVIVTEAFMFLIGTYNVVANIIIYAAVDFSTNFFICLSLTVIIPRTSNHASIFCI